MDRFYALTHVHVYVLTQRLPVVVDVYVLTQQQPLHAADDSDSDSHLSLTFASTELRMHQTRPRRGHYRHSLTVRPVFSDCSRSVHPP